MKEEEKARKEQDEVIVKLGAMVIELSLRLTALESVLAKHGLLSPEELEARDKEVRHAFSSGYQQGRKADLEQQNKQLRERVLDLLSKFEGPKQ